MTCVIRALARANLGKRALIKTRYLPLPELPVRRWGPRNKQAVIEAACNRMGLKSIKALKPLKDVLPPEVTYDEIRLVLAQLRREQTVKPERAPT